MYKTRCVLALVALCVGLALSSAQTSIHIRDIDDLKNRLTEAGEKLVVINFMATWCSKSMRFGPRLDEIATEMADAIVVLKIDIDECPNIVMEYKIKSVPTFVFVKSSKMVDRFAGAKLYILKNTINKLK